MREGGGEKRVLWREGGREDGRCVRFSTAGCGGKCETLLCGWLCVCVAGLERLRVQRTSWGAASAGVDQVEREVEDGRVRGGVWCSTVPRKVISRGLRLREYLMLLDVAALGEASGYLPTAIVPDLFLWSRIEKNGGKRFRSVSITEIFGDVHKEDVISWVATRFIMRCHS